MHESFRDPFHPPDASERKLNDNLLLVRCELFSLWVTNREEYLDRYLAMPPAGQAREGQDTREEYDHWEADWYSAVLQQAITDTASRGLPSWEHILELKQYAPRHFAHWTRTMSPTEQLAFSIWADDAVWINKLRALLSPDDFDTVSVKSVFPRFIRKLTAEFNAVEEPLGGPYPDFDAYSCLVDQLKDKGIYGVYEKWKVLTWHPRPSSQNPKIIAKEVERAAARFELRRSFTKLYELEFAHPQEYRERYDAMPVRDQKLFDIWEEQEYQQSVDMAKLSTASRWLPDWPTIHNNYQSGDLRDFNAMTRAERRVFTRWSRQVEYDKQLERFNRLHEMPDLLAAFRHIKSLADVHGSDSSEVSAAVGGLAEENRGVFYLWLAAQTNGTKA